MILLFVTLMGFLQAQEIPLRAGLAKADITPSGSMTMYGYTNRRCGPSNGTRDPLFAKALVLQSAETRLAIVTLDQGNIVSPALRDEVFQKLQIPVILLAASHTHSAPLPSPEYQLEMEKKVFGAVREASEKMFPASLAIGRGSLQAGYNRLLPREDGRSRALFDNLERIPYGPVDPEYVVLRVDDTGGGPRALLVHYATHAVVLGPTNCKVSADYPGVLQSKVESEMPGVQCMFVQGGAGDINPIFMARSGKEEEDFLVVRKMGELLAGGVLKAGKEARRLSVNQHPIQYKSETLKFSDRWEKDKTVELGITTVLINREIAIAATPGEPMHKLQKIWKEQADVPVPLFYGYTYSSGGTWPGYIPDLRSAAHGGYGADASTRIEVGAGEAIMQRHLIHLYDLLGMWREKPGRP